MPPPDPQFGSQDYQLAMLSLWGDNPPSVIIRIPAEEAETLSPYRIVGLMLTVTQLIQCPTTGEVFLDMISCTLSRVDLALGPAAGTAQP